MMQDYIIRATAADDTIRAFASTTRQMVEDARRAHDTTPVCTAALGRLLTGGIMFGSMLKEDKALVTLQIRSDGPAGGITVTADSHFHAKGYVNNPHVQIPLKPNGKLDLGRSRGALPKICRRRQHRDAILHRAPQVHQRATVRLRVGMEAMLTDDSPLVQRHGLLLRP